jgi:hypothetical protein
LLAAEKVVNKKQEPSLRLVNQKSHPNPTQTSALSPHNQAQDAEKNGGDGWTLNDAIITAVRSTGGMILAELMQS